MGNELKIFVLNVHKLICKLQNKVPIASDSALSSFKAHNFTNNGDFLVSCKVHKYSNIVITVFDTSFRTSPQIEVIGCLNLGKFNLLDCGLNKEMNLYAIVKEFDDILLFKQCKTTEKNGDISNAAT